MADPAEETEQQLDPNSGKGLRAELEAAKAEAKEAREQLEAARKDQRELSLHKAGLGNLTEKQINALYGNIQGEPDAEALKAEAKDLFGDGIFTQAPPTKETPAPADNGVEQIQEFSRGGTGNEPSPTAKTQLNEGLNDLISRGASPDKVLDYLFEQNASVLDS